MAVFRTYLRNKFTRVNLASRSWIFLGLLVGVFLAGLKLFRRRKRPVARLIKPFPEKWSSGLGISAFDPQLKGLSEEQVVERSEDVDLEALASEQDKAFRRKAFRQILLSTFNINLFAIAIVMLLLGSPLNTVLTLIKE